jgi:RNA-directed DNA polymerase
MTKIPSSLQDLRRRIYAKAQAAPSWRFWGLYVPICKPEVLHEAYQLAKANNGAPGVDGVTFEAIEASGRDAFLEQRRHERATRTYRPRRLRPQTIPKEGGKGVRVLAMPTIRERVVQGAFKLLLEPILEAAFQPGSYGYRPKRAAQDAVLRVAEAIGKYKTRVIAVALQAYCDNIRHPLLLAQVAQRGNDPDVLHGLKLRLHAAGKKGVAQGGVRSPLLSHLYLTAVARMLEQAKEVTRRGPYTSLE